MLLTDKFLFNLEYDTRRVSLWLKRGTRNSPIFAQERTQFRPWGLMVLAEITIGRRTYNLEWYSDGSKDNAGFHTASLVENFLEAETIQSAE
ncbi:hypothetical protein TNCV_4379761 [Trichonephila clavipes]|nr:hypothetical protein TNCV_4379761 [Trichonephila clavipes]